MRFRLVHVLLFVVFPLWRRVQVVVLDVLGLPVGKWAFGLPLRPDPAANFNKFGRQFVYFVNLGLVHYVSLIRGQVCYLN